MSSAKQVKNIHPPKFIEKFLHWSLPLELKEPVLGDLAEEYVQLAVSQPLKANYWYTRQALRTGLQFLTKTKRGLIMFLFGILGFVAIMIMTMVMAGDLSMFINVPSIIVVIPPAAFLTLACSSTQSIKNAFSMLFSEPLDFEKIELEAAKQAINSFGNMSMLMGWIGVVIGAVAISSNIDNFSALGPAFAVCMLTLFYGLLIKALCYAAEAKIQFKIINLAP